MINKNATPTFSNGSKEGVVNNLRFTVDQKVLLNVKRIKIKTVDSKPFTVN